MYTSRNAKYRFNSSYLKEEGIIGDSFRLSFSISGKYEDIEEHLDELTIEFCNQLHHRILLPNISGIIMNSDQVDVIFGGLEYSFPKDGVFVLNCEEISLRTLTQEYSKFLINRIRETGLTTDNIEKIAVSAMIKAKGQEFSFELPLSLLTPP